MNGNEMVAAYGLGSVSLAQSVYVVCGEELVRRGLRGLLEANGFSVSGESASVRQAVRRIPALRPDLVIIDDDLPDGSGAGLCRTIAAADGAIRCVLMTGETDEAVLIASILAGAWGCLSQQDHNSEQLRLIRRAAHGYTAYSRRFQAGILAPIQASEVKVPDSRFGLLSRQEMKVAVGVGRGLSNRQIGQELFLAEKTVKNMVSSVLVKLDMARRTEVAVLVSGALESNGEAVHEYRRSPDKDLITAVIVALVICTSEDGVAPLPRSVLLVDALRLAAALAAARTPGGAALDTRRNDGGKLKAPRPRRQGHQIRRA